MNDQVAFIDDFLAPFVDDLLLVGAELAHCHWLHLPIVVAEEDLVLHDLEAGAPLGEHDLVLHLLHLVVLMGEVSRYRLHLLLIWPVAFLWVQRERPQTCLGELHAHLGRRNVLEVQILRCLLLVFFGARHLL